MLNGILHSAISGLYVNAQRVASAADNVANISTTGYKRTEVRTKTVTTAQTTQSVYAAGGVQALVRPHTDVQGLLAATTNPTDLGISGNGFIPVGRAPTGGETLYTRDGAFRPDHNGDLVNASGLYLRGFAPGGTALGPVNLNRIGATADATASLSVGANLPATAAVGERFTVSAQVTDSLGNPVAVNLDFEAQAGGAFRFAITNVTNLGTGESLGPARQGDASGAVYDVNVLFGSDGLTRGYDVDGDGTIDSSHPPGIYIPSGSSSASALQVDLDLEGLTRFAGAFTVNQVQADGALYGTLSGVRVGEDGVVTAAFDNGVQRAIARVPVATFANPNGLEALSGNALRETVASGQATLRTAGVGGAGTVQGGAVELSTTDPAQEFATLITAQAAYRAGLKVLRAADELSQSLLDVRG